MTTSAPSAPPFVECERIHAGLAVSDIPAAVDFYTKKLGFKLGFTWGDPPTFAGVNLGKVQMFLQKGTPDPKGCSVYFLVGDADQLYEFRRANGVEITEEIGDREYGIRNYTVRDLHGYYLTFGHHPVQCRAANQNRAGGRAGALGEAACCSAPGPGGAQTYEREQLSRGNSAAYERRRRAAHANDRGIHSGIKEEARH